MEPGGFDGPGERSPSTSRWAVLRFPLRMAAVSWVNWAALVERFEENQNQVRSMISMKLTMLMMNIGIMM